MFRSRPSALLKMWNVLHHYILQHRTVKIYLLINLQCLNYLMIDCNTLTGIVWYGRRDESAFPVPNDTALDRRGIEFLPSPHVC